MNRRQFSGSLVLAGLFANEALTADSKVPLLRGVSLAGPEFGAHHATFSNANPGRFNKDYTYNSERTVQYFCERGIRILRLPLRWERLQPQLGKPLHPAELNRIRTVLSWAKKHQGKVILDIHNYGRYHLQVNGRPVVCIIDQAIKGKVLVSRDHFADLWSRLSQTFENNESIYAYGLMNEPHDMGDSDWQAISQVAVKAIRQRKDKTLILVAGDDWSSAPRWPKSNGAHAWIKKEHEPIAYEAHCYFDHDHSGKYQQSYDAELKKDKHLAQRGELRLIPFVKWCQANKVTGFIGELGAPRDDARWHEVLRGSLKLMNQVGMEGCYWAAGEWWGNYPLSLQPDAKMTKPAPQLKVLLDSME